MYFTLSHSLYPQKSPLSPSIIRYLYHNPMNHPVWTVHGVSQSPTHTELLPFHCRCIYTVIYETEREREKERKNNTSLQQGETSFSADSPSLSFLLQLPLFLVPSSYCIFPITSLVHLLPIHLLMIPQ